MTAIYGSLSRGSGSGTHDHEAMAVALAEWGRSRAARQLPPVALGSVHRDEEALVDDGGLALAADLRLDDRAGLAAELGVAPADLSDAHLVLLAYRRWGVACAEHLIGAFAFALWDSRTEQLLLARDHIGMRPLYYSETGGTLVFASTPEAVLAGTGAAAVPDELAVVARMVGHHGLLRDRSFVEGVAKLPAGETMTVRPGRAPVREVYWTPGPRPVLSLRHRDEYAEALRELHEQCVVAAVAGERPVATHLSGGLDSSAVAVVAQRALRARGRGLVRGFSWSPPPAGEGRSTDERDRVREIAGLLGIPVSWTSVTAGDLQADLEREVALQPNSAAVYEPGILSAARDAGIGVILSGWGGDEGVSFHGGGRLAVLARRGNPLPFWRQALAGGRREDLRGLGLARHLGARTAKDVLAPALPAPARARLGLASRSEIAEHELDWAALHPLAPEMRREAQARLRPRAGANAALAAWMGNGHLTARLEAWAHLAGPYGVEYRYPLLDRRLLDLCLSFPAHVWSAEGYNRWVFRKATEPLLPGSLVWGTPKAEPARIGSFVEMLCEGWEPATTDSSRVAKMLVAHRKAARRGAGTLPRAASAASSQPRPDAAGQVLEEPQRPPQVGEQQPGGPAPRQR